MATVAYSKESHEAARRKVEELQPFNERYHKLEGADSHLASVLDRAGQWAKAKVEYDRFATAHPMASYAAFAMRRGATLSTHRRGDSPPGDWRHRPSGGRL